MFEKNITSCLDLHEIRQGSLNKTIANPEPKLLSIFHMPGSLLIPYYNVLTY
jgi:hypothetical protein